MLLRATHNLLDLFMSQRDRQHAVLETVICKDISKRRRDNHSKTKLPQRPRRVLTRRTTTEVFISDEYRCAFIPRLIQHERWIRLTIGAVAPVVKQKLAKPRPLNP